jgi:leucine dehydrogenase
MEIVEKITNTHEKVLVASEPESDYRGIIAVHSTILGPAVGGTRFWFYGSDDDALADALRLSRGMTYKTALAGLPLGGGKSIIMGNHKNHNREVVLRAHGRFINRLKGRYITAEDVGTSPTDMDVVRLETPYVAGLLGRSGDPSPFTARGVFRAIQAAAKYVLNADNLSKVTVAIQGCGHVGYSLAKLLHEAGAKLVVSDVNPESVSRVAAEVGAEVVTPDQILRVSAEVLAPCALGGVINDQTVPELKVQIVAGAANNQLLEERHGEMLRHRNILYVPDYLANVGGVLNGCTELLGWAPAEVTSRIDEIYNTTLAIFESAKAQGIATNKAADLLAEDRLTRAAASSVH